MAPTESVTEWDYVAFGDSRTGQARWTKAYADYIETDLGVEVKLHNRAVGGQDSDELLDKLQSKEKLRELVREAEVVTVWTGGMKSWVAFYSIGSDCDVALEAMERDLGAIIAEILALRGSNDTIIRLLEDYHSQGNNQKDLGLFQEKKACVEAMNALIHQTASEYGIPVAPVYSAFNGPDGDHYPKGYLKDNVHTNTTGDAIIAGLLRELGYEVTAP